MAVPGTCDDALPVRGNHGGDNQQRSARDEPRNRVRLFEAGDREVAEEQRRGQDEHDSPSRARIEPDDAKAVWKDHAVEVGDGPED